MKPHAQLSLAYLLSVQNINRPEGHCRAQKRAFHHRYSEVCRSVRADRLRRIKYTGDEPQFFLHI